MSNIATATPGAILSALAAISLIAVIALITAMFRVMNAQEKSLEDAQTALINRQVTLEKRLGDIVREQEIRKGLKQTP